MAVLLLGLVIFLCTHSLRMAAPRMREGVLAQHGRAAWMVPYTLSSILGLALIVWGYGLARQAPLVLYTPPVGLRHAALLVMLPVFPLLIAAYVPGRIRATLGHPMLIATVLWGLAHLLANGGLADLFLFGGFALWAAADWASAARRPADTAPAAAPSVRNDAIAVIGGLVLYAAFLGGLHRVITGVPLL